LKTNNVRKFFTLFYGKILLASLFFKEKGKTPTTMTKLLTATFPAKTVLTVSLLIAGVIVIGFSSCRGPEDCGAYQGSKKSGTRSHKHKKSHRHAQVSVLETAHIA
jgi:hypothetical protein